MRNIRICRFTATVSALIMVLCLFLQAQPVYATAESYEELDKLNNSKSELEAQINELNTELNEIAAQQEELNNQIAAKQQEIDISTAQLEAAQAAELKQLSDMRLRIKYTYENSGGGFLTMLLESRDMADFINRTEQIELFSTYDHEMLVSYMEARHAVELAKAELETQKDEMDDLQAQLDVKREEFSEKLAGCQSTLEEYADQIAEVKAEIAAYEERQRQQVAARATEDKTTQYETTNEAYVASASDLQLMAAIIYCEAGNQSNTGKVAVGAVVLNRVRSGSFPNSIQEVIYQSGQFTPASSGSLATALATGSYSSCMAAAEEALGGTDPTGGCMYFRTNNGHAGLVIGAHVFY